MTPTNREPSLAFLGVLSWDELHVLDRYPTEGDWTQVRETRQGPGGTTGNLAATARSLGAAVTLFSKVGTDNRGCQIVDHLNGLGIDCRGVLTADAETDLSIVLVAHNTAERTILWRQGPSIERGDRIDIDALFGADLTVVDCIDLPLRRFVTDLPAHTRPSARLLGALTYFSDAESDDKIEIALRHDILVGNEREYRQLMGTCDGRSALAASPELMPGTNNRLAVMTMGEGGAVAITRTTRHSAPAQPVVAVDTTGAGDAFAAAIAYSQAQRWDIDRSLALANAVAGHVVSHIGAQSAIADLQTVRAMIEC